MRTSRRIAASAVVVVLCSSAASVLGSARAQAQTRDIYSFTNPPERGSTDLAVDRSGKLYGVTTTGGKACKGLGCGTIYRLIPPAAKGQPWTEETLWNFAGGGGGNLPLGKPLLDAAGNLYGTTEAGGNSGIYRDGAGTVWRLSPPAVAGGKWSFTVLYTFSGGQDGGAPVTGLVMDRSGMLYGPARIGGVLGEGVVFSLKPPAAGGSTWTETVLHSFGARNRPIQLDSPLTLSAGETTLTGAASETGGSVPYRGGAIYRLRREPSGWSYAELLNDYCCAGGGHRPKGSLVLDRNGNIFGTTERGGANGDFGTVFELSPPAPSQTAWRLQVLHAFSGPDGEHPQAGLIANRMPPALFGTTAGGGQGGAIDGSKGSRGVVFRLDPPASGPGPWTYTVLHAFAPGPDGIGGAGRIDSGLTFGWHHLLFGVASAGGRHGDGAVFALPTH